MNALPSAALKTTFESYRVLSNEGSSDALTILPDAAGCIVLILVDNHIESITLWGPMSKARHLMASSGIHNSTFILIEFWPMGFYRFFGHSDRALRDEIVDLDYAYPHLSHQLRAQLHDKGIDQLDYVLGELSQHAKPHAFDIYRETMLGTAQTHYSRRHRARLLVNDLGITEKQLLQIKRLYQTIHLLGSDKPLDEIAFLAGYYDSAHLIKSFHRLTAKKPSDYRRKMSDFYSEVGKLVL